MSRFPARCLPLAALLLAAVSVAADDPVQRAAKARTAQEALATLGVAAMEPGRKVLLEAPDLARKGSKVIVKVSSQIPGTDWIAVLAEPREAPFLQARDFAPGVDHSFVVPVEFTRTSVVQAVVRAAGKYYVVKREVKVVIEEKGGHGR